MPAITPDKARRILEEEERRIEAEREKERLRKRDGDRTLVRPHHFHATIFTARSVDDNGNMKGSTHHEVLGLSPDSCVRKALNRSLPDQTEYHISQLTECHDPTHGTREMAD